MSKKRPVVPERSKTGVVCGGSQKVVDLGAPKGLGFGPEDLRKIRAMEIRQRRASVSL